LEQCFRPQSRLRHQFALDELAGAVIGDGKKRADEVSVIFKDVGVEVENAHPDIQVLLEKIWFWNKAGGQCQVFV
jgi:hypothetical protein